MSLLQLVCQILETSEYVLSLCIRTLVYTHKSRTSIPQVVITELGVIEVHLLDSVESYGSLSLIEVSLLVLYVCRSGSNQNVFCCIFVSTCQTIAMLTNSPCD